MGNAEIVQYQDMSGDLTVWRKPDQVLADAKEAAKALISVVEQKKNPVKFNNETYLEFEDWQTVGAFYKCTTKVIDTKYVEYGGARGFEATSVVLDRNQNEIGRAESMCLSDEKNWGDVPEYEWQDELDAQGNKIWIERDGKKRPKAKKVQVGSSPKPLFQLRSMAQTRASAKALRSLFSWVVVLAGYRPQVAEEMTGNEFDQQEQRDEKKPPVNMPQSTQEAAKKAEIANRVEGTIESVKEGQGGTLWMIVDKKTVAIPATKLVAGLVEGAAVAFKTSPKNMKSGEVYLLVEEVEKVTAPSAKQELPIQEGEIVTEEKQPDVMDKAIADGSIPVGDLFDKPTEKKAEEDPSKKGKIGVSRAQRLWTIRRTNEKTTGLTEKTVYEILGKLPVPLQHLSDLDKGMHEQFEKMMAGELDWKQFLE
jgi:hypothetical protein